MAALLSWRLGIGGVSGSPAPGGNGEKETRKRDLYRQASSSFFLIFSTLLSMYSIYLPVCSFTIVFCRAYVLF